MQSNHTKTGTGPSKPAQRKRHGPRMLLACINCKDRKLRCDDHVPACRNCQQSGLVCLVEDPATKRHQPRNYLETLEKRVDQLERILRRRSETGSPGDNVDQGHCSSIGFQPDDLSVRAEHPRNERTPHTTARNEAQDNYQMDDLACKVGMLTVAAGAEPHYLGPSSAVNFCRVINPALLQAIPKNTHSLGQQSEIQSMLNVCPFPDPQSCLQLSDAYFHHIHPQYPFLYEPKFREWEANILLSESSDLSQADPVSIFFLYMVYAIGALILPNLGYLPKRLYASAQLYVQSVLQLENLEAIQAYLCYAIYSLRSPTGASVWKFSGLALRQCIELGYHRHDKVLGLPSDALYFELRKRAFWCAWTIDTVAATVLGRPLCLRDEDVDCELPHDIDGLNVSSTSITKGLFTFRLRKLWARIHASIYSDLIRSNPSHPTYLSRVQEFRNELELWRASLPPVIPQTEAPLTLFTSSYWYELYYNYTILNLYRGQLTDPRTCTETTLSECFAAAENICHGLRRQLLDNKATPTWGALHSCFIAGLTYLHCIWSSASIRKACRQNVLSSTCTDCTIALVLIAQWHEAAAPYREIFESLAARTMTMLVENSQENAGLASNAFIDSDPLDPATISQWKADISNHGIMGDSFEELLNSLINDLPQGS